MPSPINKKTYLAVSGAFSDANAVNDKHINAARSKAVIFFMIFPFLSLGSEKS
ncbi:MAG: hypothetical protein ACOYIT_08490 [Christensenellales bacterium]